MKSIKTIYKQIKCIITRSKYPTCYIDVDLWSWSMVKGNVEYNHFNTLLNYLRINK